MNFRPGLETLDTSRLPRAVYNEDGLPIMALDLGKKRIGVAVSDALGLTAQGLETVQCRNRRADLEALARVARERGVTQIVVGNPLNMSGEMGPQAEWTREYALLLQRELRLPVTLWDERLTSAAAARTLREMDARPSRKTGTVDRMAAVILLQSFLDSLAHAG